MTESAQPAQPAQPAGAASPEQAVPPVGGPHAAAAPLGAGPIGKIRGTGVAILLTIVTLGVYPLYWYCSVHTEMKRHRGSGLGGGLALLLAFLVGIVMPYLTASEVGALYESRGQRKPVSGVTGLWYFPGIFLLLIGPFVWFVKTNGALNAYWRSLGATS